MAFVVSALTDYVRENETALVIKSSFGAKTAEMIRAGGTVLSGVKSSEKIPLMDTDAVFQAGGTCGFSASGTTTFTDRSVTVGKIRVMEALCPKSLESKAIQKALSVGSKYESIPFEQEYSERKAALIAEQLETADWQGDTASATANLNKYDGLIKLIDAQSASVTATNAKVGTGTITATTGAATVAGVGTLFTTEVAVGDKIYNSAGTLVGTVLTITDATNLTLAANGAVAVTGGVYAIAPAAGYHFASAITSITTSNAMSVIDGIWMSIPARLKNKADFRIFCGWDVYEKYVKQLRDANLFHYVADQVSGELTIPGTNYKLVAVNGLNDTNRVYGMRLSNLYLAVDMENEEDKFQIFFAKEADQVRFDAEWKRGINFALPADIVTFGLTNVA
jgi:hypothetical protein